MSFRDLVNIIRSHDLSGEPVSPPGDSLQTADPQPPMRPTRQDEPLEWDPEKPLEAGHPGLRFWSGWMREAYNTELLWPACIPVYNRIWRSDPECSLARFTLESLASSASIGVEIPNHMGDMELEKPNDDDKKAQEFMYQALDDLNGGINGWLSSCVSRVPFYGWGWWEVVPGLRKRDWSNPNSGSTWKSEYDDGLIGFQEFAFRHYASFFRWHSNDWTQKIDGLVQLAPPNPLVTIPLNRSLHVKFGDTDNPEGLATMEALWRLERVKYGLELINGIGFEHAAGYLDVKADKILSDSDKSFVAQAARAVMTAQEGNYALWPSGFTGELKDVPFQAAGSLMEAIRYYGILKIALFGVQWTALGTLTSHGTYSTMKDASSFFLMTFNSMLEGFMSQADRQVGARLFSYPQNRAAFPKMSRRPHLILRRGAEKNVSLAELGQFLMAISAVLPMDEADILAIRRASGILPERIPPEGELLAKSPLNPNAQLHTPESPILPQRNESQPGSTPERKSFPTGNLSLERPLVIPEKELPVTMDYLANVTPEDMNGAVRAFNTWATENAPRFVGLLDARIE
jgi:hypothetical protein